MFIGPINNVCHRGTEKVKNVFTAEDAEDGNVKNGSLV